jgi:membrane protease YdiL (CAAX protease family)
MLVSISIKLVIMALISVFLLFKNGDKQIAIFEQQDWAVNKILPVYWALAVLSLVSLVTYRLMPNKFHQQLLSFPLTVVVGAILFTTLRHVVSKQNGLMKAIGLKKNDIYYFIAVGLIQIVAVAILLHKNRIKFVYIPFLLSYVSITLICWPVIEEVYYRGMLYIPTSRKVGLLTGAILISMLQVLPHFWQDIPALAINFTVFGLFGCYLYIKTRRIIVPVLLHSSLNFFVTLRELQSIFHRL